MVFRRLRDRHGFFPRHAGHRLDDDGSEDEPNSTSALPDVSRADPEVPFHAETTSADCVVVEPHVARAWYARREADARTELRRQHTLRQQQQRCLQEPPHAAPSGTNSSTNPTRSPSQNAIDVDSLSVWQLDECCTSDPLSLRQSIASHSRKPPLAPHRTKRATVTPQWSNRSMVDLDDESRSSLRGQPHSSNASLAFSDQTPVMSNRDVRAVAAPSTQGRFSSHSDFSVPPLSSNCSPDPNEILSTTSTFHCREMWDLRRWYGRLLYVLLLFLLLSMSTLITTAVLFRRAGQAVTPAVEPDSPTGSARGGGRLSSRPMAIRPTSRPQSSPTMAPMSQVTLDVVNAPLDTTSPTSRPTVSPGTAFPTNAPSPVPSAAVELTVVNGTVATLAPTPSLDELAQRLVVVSTQRDPLEDGSFAASIALSGDGTIVAVGARTSGHVYLFQSGSGADGTTWQERGILSSPTLTAGAGSTVALSDTGAVLVVSDPEYNNRTGRVYLYAFDGETGRYDDAKRLELDPVESSAQGYFGAAVAVAPSGRFIVIGAPFANQVSVYQLNVDTNQWTLIGLPLDGPDGECGSAVDMVENVDDGTLTVAVSCPGDLETNGHVAVYQWIASSNDWRPLSNKMTNNAVEPAESNDGYGEFLSLAQTANGSFRLAIGAPNKRDTGMILVYQLDMELDSWVLLGNGPISSETPTRAIGYAVKLLDKGQLLVTGSPGLDQSPGTVLLFRFHSESNGFQSMTSGETPVTLLASNAGDGFGSALDVARRDDQRLVLVVGAPREFSQPERQGYATILEENAL